MCILMSSVLYKGHIYDKCVMLVMMNFYKQSDPITSNPYSCLFCVGSAASFLLVK
jgi:hypothetical protein